jgi:TonB family protein
VERGTAALQTKNFSQALNEFNRALDADPSNQRAREAFNSATDQLHGDLRNHLVEWRKYFESREYLKAKDTFERVLHMSPDEISYAADYIRQQYQNLLEREHRLWTQACTRQDPIAMDSIRQGIRAIDRSGELNREVLEQIQSCPAARQCSEVASVIALDRVKRKVYPEVDPALRPSSKVAVKILINNEGETTVLDIDNPDGNPVVSQSVRAAMERWKFDPALAARSSGQCGVTRFLIEFEQ